MSDTELRSGFVPGPKFQALSSEERGMALRLNMLMTDYKKPMDFTAQRLDEAATVWKKWQRVATDTGAVVPADVLNALLDDLNTPKAIAAINKLAKERRGGELYAAMNLMGLVIEGDKK
jgi:cysteinyl-tRNA synthetase